MVTATLALKDTNLCRRAKAGDSDAMDTLFTGARPLIRSRIHLVIGGGHWPANVEREDAEQEAEMAVFRALQSWDGVRPFSTLVVTCIDRQLRRWRSKTFPVVHVPENVYSRGEYHEQAPLPLLGATDDERSLLDVLTTSGSGWGADPLETLTERCNVQMWQQLMDDEEFIARTNRPRMQAKRPRVVRRALPFTVVRQRNATVGSLAIDFGPLGTADTAPAPRTPRVREEPAAPLSQPVNLFDLPAVKVALGLAPLLVPVFTRGAKVASMMLNFDLFGVEKSTPEPKAPRPRARRESIAPRSRPLNLFDFVA